MAVLAPPGLLLMHVSDEELVYPYPLAQAKTARH